MTSERLRECTERPLSEGLLVGASCHNEQELVQAQRIGADFAVLAPVLATESHPGATILGWQQFSALMDKTVIPVYALGGLGREHLSQAQACGAQGIAAIRALWEDPEQ